MRKSDTEDPEPPAAPAAGYTDFLRASCAQWLLVLVT